MSIFDLLFAAAGAEPIDQLNIYTGNLPSAAFWHAIGYGNGTFVVVAHDSTAAAYSKDGGKTFTSSKLPSSSNWLDVVYCGDDTFIAFPNSSTSYPARSTDGGKTWQNLPTRPTGITFQRGNEYANGVLVCVSNTKSAYSYDKGNTWTVVSSINTGNSNSSLAFGDGVFLSFFAGTSSLRSTKTTDYGKTWTSVTMDGGIVSGIYPSITFGNGVFVASSFTSDSSVYSKAYSNDYGESWTLVKPFGVANLASTAFGSGVFVSVGSGGSAAYSKDGGKKWLKQTMPTNLLYRDIAYGDGVFVALAASANKVTIISV